MQVVEDEVMAFPVAVEEDEDMVARILICLSRSATRHHPPAAPLKPQPTTPTEGLTRSLLPPETSWGVRRARTRPVTTEVPVAAKREDEVAAAGGNRASPTTPLSWSGESGSVCWRRDQSSSREQEAAPAPKAEPYCIGERIRTPPVRRLPAETLLGCAGPHGELPVRVSAATFLSSYASTDKNKAAAGGPGTSRTAEQVGLGRTGKKTTVAELLALEESLLQEQEELQKELEKHKEIYQALLEGNVRLKKVESRLAPHTGVSKQAATYVASEAAAKREWPQQAHLESTSKCQTIRELTSTVSVTPEEDKRKELLQCTNSPVSVPGGYTFLFDLNCLPRS